MSSSGIVVFLEDRGVNVDVMKSKVGHT